MVAVPFFHELLRSLPTFSDTYIFTFRPTRFNPNISLLLYDKRKIPTKRSEELSVKFVVWSSKW